MVLPPVVGVAYDSVTSILNATRFRLNAKLPHLFPTSGKILDETQASTQQAFNNAYRRFQEMAADAGAERFYSQIDIIGVPPVTNLDPASAQSISWFQFFDGTNYQTSPVLPSNLVTPLWMSERQTGTNFPFPDVDNPNMRCQTDGLQAWPKRQLNAQWEWREDTIFFPGALLSVDFRIRYRLFLPDITDVGTIRWWNVSVPIMRCQDAMAWLVASEFAAARAADGDASEQMMAVAAACMEQGQAAVKLWANRDVMKNQRDDVRRVPYGYGSRGSGFGWR